MPPPIDISATAAEQSESNASNIEHERSNGVENEKSSNGAQTGNDEEMDADDDVEMGDAQEDDEEEGVTRNDEEEEENGDEERNGTLEEAHKEEDGDEQMEDEAHGAPEEVRFFPSCLYTVFRICLVKAWAMPGKQRESWHWKTRKPNKWSPILSHDCTQGGEVIFSLLRSLLRFFFCVFFVVISCGQYFRYVYSQAHGAEKKYGEFFRLAQKRSFTTANGHTVPLWNSRCRREGSWLAGAFFRFIKIVRVAKRKGHRFIISGTARDCTNCLGDQSVAVGAVERKKSELSKMRTGFEGERVKPHDMLTDLARPGLLEDLKLRKLHCVIYIRK